MELGARPQKPPNSWKKTDTIELELGKQVQTMWQGQQRMTEIVEDEGAARVEATQDSEEEQTEIISDEAEKRADERARFEEQWNRKLFQLTADRLAQLDAEMAEALAKAEELEADKTAIIESRIRRQQIPMRKSSKNGSEQAP